MLESMFWPRPVKEMVEEVAMRPAVERVPENSAEPWTEKAWAGVVLPTPTLPEDRMVRAVVVAPAEASAKTENREKFEREEVAETVKMESGEVVPKPVRDTPAA